MLASRGGPPHLPFGAIVMTQSAIGNAVRQCRTEYSFADSELARLSGLSLARLRAIESGTAPSISELSALAAALGVSPGDLRRGKLEDPKRSVARFRAPLGVSALPAHDVRLLARGAELGRICAFLGQLLGAGESAIQAHRKVLPVRSHLVPWRQGYDLGERARANLATGGSPLRSVQAKLESLGVHVAFVTFETSDVLAASLFEPGAAPVILLNGAHSRVSESLPRRAVLAHELCHLLHDGGERDLLAIVSRPEEDLSYEQRANGFAPSFMAPASHVQLEGEEPGAIVLQLAYGWGFSYEGAAWHAKNLELITPEEASALVRAPKAVSAPGFEDPIDRRDPLKLGLEAEATPLTAGLISDRILLALSNELISRGRAAELLSFR
jgi:Zn-dependent peptidase ImmA (M78 family)/transcriptional regulator with XRE-family HTH domain